jgi:hypothetical protein
VTESASGRRRDPPRGRSSVLLAALALVWVLSLSAASERAHGADGMALLFWAALGGGLLALSATALALSGLYQTREARGPLFAGLGASLLTLLGLALVLLRVL